MQQQAEHAEEADRAQRDRRQAALLERAGGADALHLQAVVADEQCRRAHPVRDVGVLEVQAQLAVRAQQGHEPCRKGDQPAASELALVGLAILEQLGVHAEARIDEEHTLVDEADLYWLRGAGQQHARRGGGVGRNAVRAAEVIEGALRQHAEREAAAKHGLRDGVDRAVAAGRDDDAGVGLCCGDGGLRDFRQARRIVGAMKSMRAPGFTQHIRDHGLRRVGILVPRAGVDDDVQRRRWRWRSRHDGIMATLNKSPWMRAPRFGMGCKAQTAAIARAMARICNAADRPNRGCARREGLVQRCHLCIRRAPTRLRCAPT